MKFFYTPIIMFFFPLSIIIQAQNLPKFSGLMFGDYFYNLRHHSSSEEGMNAFQFRRIFVTADYLISEKFNSRFRIEADNISNANSKNNKMNVWVKDAYLEWIDIFNGSNLFIGVSPTPAFEVSTNIWSNRFIEKTILDYNSIVSSRDMGIDLKGNLMDNGKIKYWIKIGNNANSGPESNKQKRFYGLLEFYPSKNLIFTTYGDFTTISSVYDNVSMTNKNTNSYVLALFCNFKCKNLSTGIESFLRNSKNAYRESELYELTDFKTYGISLWAYYNLTNKFNLIGRYDYYDPNSQINNDDNELIILAIDYKPNTRVHISPNVQIKTYKNEGKNDVIPRITFFWQF
ncbi:hypothetical protein [Rosettibacter firmus]|uniref:hypothetical protein n=1 Tax=Rosettibacter firmus TaxID=3111522 RepID=UPI00336BE3FF